MRALAPAIVCTDRIDFLSGVRENSRSHSRMSAGPEPFEWLLQNFERTDGLGL